MCRAARLKPEALAVRVGGETIASASDLSIRGALACFAGVEATLTPQRAAIAGRILKEIVDRLQFLDDMGLEYLTLSRGSTTLSGGESQHFEDVRKLLEVLHALVVAGNSVIVIEHNLEVIKTADWVLDLGPEGGEGGGRIVAAGTPETVAATDGSHTGRFLRPLLTMPGRRKRA